MIFRLFLIACLLLPFRATAAGSEYSQTPFYNAKDEAQTLKQFQGTPVIVFLWSKTCAVCMASLTALDSLRQKYPSEQLKIIPIMSKKANLNDARLIMVKLDIRRLPIYLDKDSIFANSIGLKSFPLAVLLNAEGKEIQRLKGRVDWTSPLITHKLDNLIKEVSHAGQ